MKISKVFAFWVIFLSFFVFAPVAKADWVWSPEQGKFINTDEGGQDAAQDAFERALDFFKEKKLDKAADEFQLILKKYPKSNVAPESEYRLGTIYEETGDLLKAHKAYKSLIKNYPQSERFDEVIEREYEIGNAFLSGKKGKVLGLEISPSLPSAIEVYKQIVEVAPFGPFGDKAQYQLGLAYYKAGQYDESIEAFQELVDQYPQSELAKDARLQMAEASYAQSKIEMRDQSALDAAARQADRYLKRYPGSDDAEKAAKIRQEVDEKNAEKNYRIGFYYEKQNRLESALIYYRDTSKRYPNTAWGEKAADKLKSLEQPVTYLTAKEAEVRAELEKLETELKILGDGDKAKKKVIEAEIKKLNKKLHEIDKSKSDSLNRRKQDLKRRERELNRKFKEFERKKKRFKDNTTPEFQKAMARWQASLEAERDAIEEEKDRLANWREELGVPSEPFYQSMIAFMQPDTPLEQVRQVGEKDLYKMARKKKDLLEEKEKLYKRYNELQKDLAPQISDSGVEIKRLRGAERKRIAEKPPEQLTAREKEIQQIEKELDEKLVLYEKNFGKMAEQELETLMAKQAGHPVPAVSPLDVGPDNLQNRPLNDLLALKMHLEEKLTTEQYIVDTLSSAFSRELVLQEQKAMMDSLESREEIDPRKLRKEIKAVERDIRQRYQDIQDRHEKKKKLLEELDQTLHADQNKTLRTLAKPATGTFYLVKSFLFGLPNKDVELTKEAKAKGDARAKELQQEIELESLLIEAQDLEITRLEKKHEILNAKASLAGGYKFRSSYVKAPYVFINEAVESARRIVPKKDRKEILLNRLDRQSKELDGIKTRLKKVEAAIAEKSSPVASSAAAVSSASEATPKGDGSEAVASTQKSEPMLNEQALREEVMRLFERLEVAYSIYAEEQGILSDEYRAKLEQEMKGASADKEKVKQFNELKKVESELCEVTEKEMQIDAEERAILNERLEKLDDLLPGVKSKAMTQDLMTEKERIRQRLQDLEIRHDFLAREKDRFDKKA